MNIYSSSVLLNNLMNTNVLDVSPSKKLCVYLVFRAIELELPVGVSFC